MTPNVRFAAGLGLMICAAGFPAARAQAPERRARRRRHFRSTSTTSTSMSWSTDERGNFVGDLTAREFEVFEDGKPVKVDTFPSSISLWSGGARRISAGRAVRQDVHSNRSTLEGRFYVIVLDDIGTSAAAIAIRHQGGPAVRRTARRAERHGSGRVHEWPPRSCAGLHERSHAAAGLHRQIHGHEAQVIDTGQAGRVLPGQGARRRTCRRNRASLVDTTSAAARAQSPFSRGEGYANRSYDMNDIERGQRALGVLGQLKNYAEFLANVRGRRKAMVLFSEGIDYPVHDIFSSHDASAVLKRWKTPSARPRGPTSISLPSTREASSA